MTTTIEGREPLNVSVEERRINGFFVVAVTTGDPWRQKCYIVGEEKSGEAVVVDPGDAGETICNVVRGRNLHVLDVLLTHGHHDHVGAVSAVCREFHVGCLVDKGDSRLLRQAPLYAFRFAGRQIEVPAPVKFFQGDHYYLGQQCVRIHRTPGHTEGSVVFEFPGFALTGDTILNHKVGRTDMPGGNRVKLNDSITALLQGLPADTLLFSGHGPPWSAAEARKWWLSLSGAAPVDCAHETAE